MAQPFVGEIKLFAGNFAINGWAFCNGQLLSISEFETLFVLIGTTYGGDGVTTFALPNLQGRVALHQGTGPGLTTRVMGEISGTENVTLTSGQLPSHTHTVIALTGDATATAPGSTVLPARPSGSTTEFLYLPGAASPTTDTPPAAASVSSNGGNQPHDNLMPSLALNYIIALFGIFPSQN